MLVYEDHLLPCSQTFVLNQAESFKRFTPYYVGIRPVRDGLDLPAHRSMFLNYGDGPGKIREALFRLAGLAPGLIRTLRPLKPALVHAHFGPDALNALVIAQTLDLPLIVTHHGYDVTTKPEFPISFAHKQYLRHKQVLQRGGQLFLAVSRYIRENLVAQGFPEDRVRVHYIGVDTSFFSPSPECPREPIVLFVGRLVENKGCTFLLRAMTKVQMQCPEARLVVIGEGPLRADLELEARSAKLNCSFLGQQPQTVVLEWMRRASAFCVPCVTAANGVAEAFGLVFIEAQATGLPVVTFASGGVAEAISEDVTGFLVPEKDVDGLAANLVRLLREPQLWHNFSEAGIARVRSKFDLSTQSRELESLYDQVLISYTKARSAPFNASTMHARWRTS